MTNSTPNTLFSAATLEQWLAHLEQLHPNAIELGLKRITEVGQRLSLIHFDAKVITVAGTNGKGTTCAYLEKILLDAGFKVGVYSSPHIHRYNERLRINSQELTDQAHCDAFAIIEKAREIISLSYFEYATLACLYLLQQANCDYILLEVGLGGRLDATNMVESDLSVVTTIGIDHIDWLGSDREKIGFEKAGVFRANKPAICGELDVPQSIIDHASNISAQLKLASRDFSFAMLDDQHWSWTGQNKTLSPIKQTLMPMQNASTALAVIEALNLSIAEEQLIASVENAALAGRLQAISGYDCDFYIDVAHNPQSAQYLASQIKRLKHEKPESCQVHAVVGMLSDKDMTSTLSAINAQINEYHFADLNCYRGASAATLLEAYQGSEDNQHNVTCYENVSSAVDKVVQNVSASDIVIVFGSFHTVSDILTK
ncbi:bifunctional tetrahydrofolate synthase/dihydrofolate synthase [Psychromonas sp. B3M02]|uniref:bifunctional tetrahydrofolate synthase/dihydrofolate synthase n=1 Tax=Psychromonas sp. B3M02 TaxID=2267226 RepID=UPI000DE8D2F3|nr:bifunctional tetrahydrofolate synthase/dihydrofolate synthase [Psychromonas sp. B3M02]RBW47153.1 bifunctional tetrahydrofolate synthase/dihydrofolate synthase [Psychromonas sp. B3M02]